MGCKIFGNVVVMVAVLVVVMAVVVVMVAMVVAVLVVGYQGWTGLSCYCRKSTGT